MPKRKKGTKPAVANKKKPKQEVNPTSLPPPTPPTPPTPAVFPTEIFALILSNFRSDPDEPISYRSKWQEVPNKDVLAKCMRVSTLFKALAAPLLYEVMEWKDMEQDPLQVLNEGKALRGRSAQWLTMNTETRHIRMVNFRPHDREGCCRTGKLIRQRPINIPVLKFKLSEFHKESGRNLNYGECFDCPLMLDLAPKKVVVTSHGKYDDLHPNYSRSAAVEELVFSIDLRKSDMRDLYPSLDGQAKRLVVILSLARYADRLGPARLSLDDYLMHDMSDLAIRVALNARNRHSASEMIMVNFDASNEDLSTNARTHFEPALKREMKEAIDILEDMGSSEKSHYNYKSSAELALVRPKFITMREYLTNHDWEGVYTKTEVEKMLKEDVEE